MQRENELKKLKETSNWDVIVIGGGATGLGVAVDAATRGFKTLLLEAVDFAKGTSSRSTKLVHGGVRYLEQGNISLVKESLYERGLMLQNAKHLVKKQKFIIPNYSWLNTFIYLFGLKLYDILAGKLSFGRSVLISKRETLELVPNIQYKSLKNAVVYYDGQFDDARMAINLAQTAVENGACVLNYFRVSKLLFDETKKIMGLEAIDTETNQSYSIKGKTIINATGVFTDGVLKMDDPKFSPSIVPSQGVHLVFDAALLPCSSALLIPKTTDGRVLFAVPWHQKIVVGTTDTPIKNTAIEPTALGEEIDFILKNCEKYFTKPPSKADIQSVFVGLRPLSISKNNTLNTKKLSRTHKINVSSSNLISITGGKWTTYRKMAEDVLDKAIELRFLPYKKCITKSLSIHGNTAQENILNHLAVYGSDADLILQLEKENPSWNKKIHPNHPYTIAEVIWTIRNEMARTIDDVLARRLRLLFLDRQAALESAEQIADILMAELNKDQQWKDQQITDFKNIASHFSLS